MVFAPDGDFATPGHYRATTAGRGSTRRDGPRPAYTPTMSAQPPMVPDLRARLRSDDFLLGTWLTILDPTVPELLAGSGFDLLVADGEHGPVATSDLVAMLIATRAAGVPLLYRVAANEPVRIMHALDSGASGVVIPQVRTVADVTRAVAWCRYPPVGLRGVAPRRASGYGRGTAAYLAAADGLVTCCVQIETREALDDLDAILAVPGVDTILVGPNDLAAAIGHTGDLAHPDVEAAIARIVERATGAGIPAGIWTNSPTQARHRRSQGYRWATVGADYGFMLTAADAAVREVREG
jgi:2-keto-3-deoxy-L-rhamnonate aldolase RhmA